MVGLINGIMDERSLPDRANGDDESVIMVVKQVRPLPVHSTLYCMLCLLGVAIIKVFTSLNNYSNNQQNHHSHSNFTNNITSIVLYNWSKYDSYHSWAQRKLSLLNILLSINSNFLQDLTDLTINRCNLQKFNDLHFQRFKTM